MSAPDLPPDLPGPDHRAAAVPNRFIVSPAARKWLYLVAVAAFGVLGLYGIVSPEETGPWLELVSAVLGVGAASLAAANVPSR